MYGLCCGFGFGGTEHSDGPVCWRPGLGEKEEDAPVDHSPINSSPVGSSSSISLPLLLNSTSCPS